MPFRAILACRGDTGQIVGITILTDDDPPPGERPVTSTGREVWADMPSVGARMLQGKVQGRTLVDVNILSFSPIYDPI